MNTLARSALIGLCVFGFLAFIGNRLEARVGTHGLDFTNVFVAAAAAGIGCAIGSSWLTRERWFPVAASLIILVSLGFAVLQLWGALIVALAF